jgi:hypothetical protein
METKKYRPKIDKLYWILLLFTNAVCVPLLFIPPFFSLVTLFVTLPLFVFVNYFFVSPLFGYVELREDGFFIKYGFFLKRYIPYGKIRSVSKERKFYTESMLSLKNALDHVNIKYGSFDVTSVSVLDEDTMISELHARCGIPTKTDI